MAGDGVRAGNRAGASSVHGGQKLQFGFLESLQWSLKTSPSRPGPSNPCPLDKLQSTEPITSQNSSMCWDQHLNTWACEWGDFYSNYYISCGVLCLWKQHISAMSMEKRSLSLPFKSLMVLTLLNDTRSGAELTSPSFMKLRSVL